MGNGIKIKKRFCRLLIFGILFCAICVDRAGMTVRAAEQPFMIDAKMLLSNQSAYEIQITIENQGQDWEGTVRLMMEQGQKTNVCAYDTELSLPQGSTKQFAVKVPKGSLERTDGALQVTLLDKNGEETARKELGRLLQTEADTLSMGILSDDYISLTYLDMGGSELYYDGKNYPISLEELNQDNLADSLNALNFLVIDSYHTGILSDEERKDIENWLNNGGMLIIGTGENVEAVLEGLDALEIQCSKVYEPGEIGGSNAYMDVSQLHMAELTDVSGQYKEEYNTFTKMRSFGDGAVLILPYSLVEAAKYRSAGDYEQQNRFVDDMLGRVINYADSPYGLSQYTYNYESMYFFKVMNGHLGDGSSRLHFGGLKWIIILYVIFVGPVLYLILRFTKKRDFYWVAVPITTLVGIFLVYWAGRGFEIVNTHVYSVTIENLDAKENAQTYLHCYDAGHKEWDLRLAEGYDYAGPLEDSYYMSSEKDYYYHVRKEGDRLFFGMNPTRGFEDGCFQAGIVKEPEEGSIYSDVRVNGQQGISGKVINETKRDFQYFALCVGDDMYVYKNLPAGAEVKLEEAEVVYNNDGTGGGYRYAYGVLGYCDGFLEDVQDGEMAEDIDILVALGMGVLRVDAMETSSMAVIVGVTEDYDKVIDDDCSEVSYGCFYAVQ